MWNSSDMIANRQVDAEQSLLSAGVGLRFNIQKFAGAIMRIDVARTIYPDEGVGLALGVGQFF